MQVLQDISSIEVDYSKKPKQLPSCFKSNTQSTWKKIVNSLVIYSESCYQFLLAIEHLLKPQYKGTAKEFMKHPDQYEYFVEWWCESRMILETQLMGDYLAYGDSVAGKAILKILEKRYGEHFNDKRLTYEAITKTSQETNLPKEKIEFVLQS